MQNSPGDAYRIRLRSLQWASGLLRDLSHSEDSDAVVVAANWALDAVYDLWEIYRKTANLSRKINTQDEHLGKLGTPLIGGLLFIRGEKTHQAQHVHQLNPFKDLPYEFANLTDWAWRKIENTNPNFHQRHSWYQDHVAHRALWVPLDQAFYWFIDNSPIKIIGQDAQDVPGWIAGVTPHRTTDHII